MLETPRRKTSLPAPLRTSPPRTGPVSFARRQSEESRAAGVVYLCHRRRWAIIGTSHTHGSTDVHTDALEAALTVA